MIITSISYQAVKNLGNYESERLEATATVEEDENVTEATKQLKAFVHAGLNAPASPSDSESNPLFDNLSADRF